MTKGACEATEAEGRQCVRRGGAHEEGTGSALVGLTCWRETDTQTRDWVHDQEKTEVWVP